MKYYKTEYGRLLKMVYEGPHKSFYVWINNHWQYYGHYPAAGSTIFEITKEEAFIEIL